MVANSPSYMSEDEVRKLVNDFDTNRLRELESKALGNKNELTSSLFEAVKKEKDTPLDKHHLETFDMKLQMKKMQEQLMRLQEKNSLLQSRNQRLENNNKQLEVDLKLARE